MTLKCSPCTLELRFCGEPRDGIQGGVTPVTPWQKLTLSCHHPTCLSTSTSFRPLHLFISSSSSPTSSPCKMADDDSDGEDFYDVDSPLSTSLYGTPKHSSTYSPTKHRSTDRLYSIAASHRHVIPESEGTSLLTARDGRGGSYLSMSRLETPDQYESGSSSPRPLGILTRKISRVFQSKAYDYDSNKHSLAAVGSGERVW